MTQHADVLPDTPSDRLPVHPAVGDSEQRSVYVVGAVPANDYDAWSDRALRGLIGQRPRVIIDGDWSRTAGTAEVVAASNYRPAGPHVGLVMPAYVAEAAGLDPHVVTGIGVGFTLADATHNADLSRRSLHHVELRTVWADGRAL